MNPKISFTDLRQRFKSPSPIGNYNNATFQKVPSKSFLSPTPSLKDLRGHLSTFKNTGGQDITQEKHRS